MKPHMSVTFCCVTALFVTACSSRPRYFNANLATPPADMAQYQKDFATCETLARNGHTSGFKAAAGATAAGTAAGFGVVAATAAVASGAGSLERF